MGEEPGKVTPGTVVPGEPLTLWGGMVYRSYQ
jgi:hypothetical protein